ncbi:hypothetical protein JVU11DRAFT_392 [Chiua virens]|nr:hypothetical protein JVU11DRAFT_392 [Chiua virens]
MSFIQRFVLPKLPTVLATQARVDLPGYEIWLHNIDNVHVLPTELDVARFEEALSKALQLYSHAAGQLRCNDGHWSIELTNTAIPVDIDYKLDLNSNSFLSGDWVVQDDISPFLNNQPIGANLVNGGAPLVRLKLTFFNKETCIGVSWHHTLGLLLFLDAFFQGLYDIPSIGDSITLSHFMHALSQFYQGVSLKYPAPTFRKHHFPTPSPSLSAEYWPRMPHLHKSCVFSELAEIFYESCRDAEHLRWRFDNHDLADLRLMLSSQKETYLSKQDCLIAYIVAVLNYHKSVPVQKVTNTSSVLSNIPTDMANIATTLRQTLIQCRDPDYVYKWMTVANKHMLETANAGKSFLFSYLDNSINVNSNTIIDWHGAHFGCPDGSRFHTSGVAKSYLRCFKSNPTKGDDGVWYPRQSIDISMGTTSELKPKLLETLAYGIPYMLDNGHTRQCLIY